MRNRSWIAPFAVLAALFTPACGWVTSERGRLEGLDLRACHVAQLAEEVRCGVLRVPESRTDTGGRAIDIRFAVLPALRRTKAEDAFFVFAGGPGQGARDFAAAADRYFRKIRRTRDIVLVDLRGTGGSNRLACPLPADELDALTDISWFERRMPECLLALNADPRHYTHAEALADVDQIRQRLGYPTINLWGGSWGTRAALLYALRYPSHVRTVVLDGAVPLTMEFPRSASRDAQAALDLLIAQCTADAECRSRYPDAAAMIAALERRLATGPLAGRLPHPRTGKMVSISLPRDAVFDTIRGALYVPQDAVGVLYLVGRALEGDLAPLVAQAIRTASGTTDDMAIGATMAILCSEDLPEIVQPGFGEDARGSVFGTAYADVWRRRCAAWPRGPRIELHRNATTSVPALILSGTHDPVTPPRWGDAMALHFPRHQQVVVPAAAHNASFTGCVPDLIVDFMASGGGGVDASCAGRAAWPQIVLGSEGPRR